MFLKHKAEIFRNLFLTALDLVIDEFFHFTARCADQVVVMVPLIQFEYRCAGLEMATTENARFGELHQYAINGGKSNIDFFVQQETINLFCRQMFDLAFMK